MAVRMEEDEEVGFGSIHDRLRHALMIGEVGGTFEQRLEQLHDHCRKVGVRGVHSTRMTLRRWFGGSGNPPEYWLQIVADFLGVTYRWLHTGDGVMLNKRGGRIVKMEEGTTPKAKDGKGPEAKDEGGPPKNEPPKNVRRVAKPKDRKSAKQPDDPAPLDEDPVVSIPTKEDVWEGKAPHIVTFIKQSESVEALEAIKTAEEGNPKKVRVTILREVEKRMKELKPEE